MRLFISYRRKDQAATAGRLFDRLSQRFGPDSVFRDVDCVPIGSDFRRQIERAISSADALLVLIGPMGLFSTSSSVGTASASTQVDYIQLEIECALRAEIPIIPVLIDGAKMPTPGDFPPSVRDFAYRQAACVDGDRRFDGNVVALIEALELACAHRKLEAKDPSLSAISSLLALASPRRNALEVRCVRTIPELRDLWLIDKAAYGNANLDFELFRAWWMAFPQGLQAIFSDEKVIGAVGLWPVPEDWMTSFLAGTACEADLSASRIREVANAPCQYWYVSGIVLSEQWQNTSAISVLLREAAMTWALEAELKRPVTIFAMAISEQGERLLGRFGFTLATPSDLTRDGFSLYVRKISRADLKSLVGGA